MILAPENPDRFARRARIQTNCFKEWGARIGVPRRGSNIAANIIGISSGASAPEILVENFISDLKKRFTINIDEVEIIKEDVVFKIPKKLN